MKNKIYGLLVLAGLTVSCERRSDLCQCIDSNVEALEAYRERGYTGQSRTNDPVCKQFEEDKSPEALKKLTEESKKCPNNDKLEDELKLMMEHFQAKGQN